MLVEAACAQVNVAISHLQWGGHVRLVTRGRDEFWERLAASLRGAHEVEIVELDADDVDLRYAEQARESDWGLKPGTLVIHHDPLRGTGGHATSDDIRGIVARGAACVSLEFPSGRHQDPRVRAAYLRALAHPVSRLKAAARELGATLRAAAAPLEIVSGSSRLTIPDGALVLDDFTVLQRGPQLMQLPLGEVWLLPDPARLEGTLLVDTRGHRTELITIEGGRVCSEGWWGQESAVEIGFGVNPSAIPIPTALMEKWPGRIHVGFGDSMLLGGPRESRRHGDVFLSADSQLVANGRRVDTGVLEG